MEKYIKLYRKYGEQKADQIMAYGNDSDDPKFKGIGGPDSTIPNVLVSDHLINFQNKLGVSDNTNINIKPKNLEVSEQPFTKKSTNKNENIINSSNNLDIKNLQKEIKTKFNYDLTEDKIKILLDKNISLAEKTKLLGYKLPTFAEKTSENESFITKLLDFTKQLTNWSGRQLDKISNEEEQEVKTIALNNNLIVDKKPDKIRVTGDTIKLSDRKYYTNEIIDLKTNKLGYRNRGDLKEINTEGAIITSFYPFQQVSNFNLDEIKTTETFIGIDKKGNFKVGSIDKFDEKDFASKVFSNKVKEFKLDNKGNILLEKRNKDNPRNPVPVVIAIDDNGNEITGHLGLLTKPNIKNPYNQYGKIQGGRLILKSKKETILVSGSIQNIVNEFNRLKQEGDEYIEVIALDNGSYNLALRTYDQILKSEDLKDYDLQNKEGGNFIYLKD